MGKNGKEYLPHAVTVNEYLDEKIPEKETSGHAEFINDIEYNGKPVNVLRFFEEKIEKGKVVRTDFQWLTSIRITGNNAEK